MGVSLLRIKFALKITLCSRTSLVYNLELGWDHLEQGQGGLGVVLHDAPVVLHLLEERRPLLLAVGLADEVPDQLNSLQHNMV